MTKNYRKFIFDMDGTLVDSKESVEKAWRAWAEKHDLDLAAILETSHGRPSEEAIQEFMPHLDPIQEAQWLEDIELQNVDSVQAIRGAVEFLSLLKPDEWGIFTSAPKELAVQRLKAAGIDIPNVFITVEDVTLGKPNPEGYQLAAQLLGAKPCECLVFEDAPAGIQSGLSAGCDVINITAAAPCAYSAIGCEPAEDYYGVSVNLNGRLLSL